MADPDEKTALVVVPDYQLSLAIGKEGQNARLAARLTGFKIDIKSETQARESGDFDYEDEEEYYEEYESDEDGAFEEPKTEEADGYVEAEDLEEDGYAEAKEEETEDFGDAFADEEFEAEAVEEYEDEK